MKNQRILFLGTHGQMNIGDELLLETFLAQLGKDNRYFVNSYNPAFTARQLGNRFQAEVFNTATERSKLLKYMYQADLLFFGGGSIIKELYATTGRHPYSTLLMVLAIVTFAKQVMHKPIVMSNIGVGPLRTRGGERLAAWILRQVDVVSVRDGKSYETCLRLGLKPDRVQRIADAVFANPPSVFLRDGSSLSQSAGGPLKIALNLNYDIENPSNWETFQRNLADALHALAARHLVEIHTLPMQSHFKAMHDARMLEDFRARLPDLAWVTHIVEDHCQAAAVIAQCDLLLAERLHALVIAAILGKPFYALIYDVKVRELTAELGMRDYAVDVNYPFDPMKMVHGIEQALEHAAQIGCHLAGRSAAWRSDLIAYFASLEQRLALKDRMEPA
jgi:polysaccharide pyruvyl transferase CsaB